MTKYDPSKHIPEIARDLKTLSPTKIVEEILKRFNVKKEHSSVSMWFSRHPETYEQLTKELFQGLPTEEQAVTSNIFQDSDFRELPSVKTWVEYLRVVRRIKEETINHLVLSLRQVCEGKLRKRKIDFVAEGKWTYKHPDRLTFQDAKTFLSLMKERKYDLYEYSKALKSFLVVARRITEGSTLLVGRPSGFGKLRDLFVIRSTLDKMLVWIRETYGQEPFLIDQIMFREASRINGVLGDAERPRMLKDFNEQAMILTTYEKGLERQYGVDGKRVDLDLSAEPDLFEMLRDFIRQRNITSVNDPIWTLDAERMAKINREAQLKFCPEILQKYERVNPNHFWRHMNAQHQLIATDYNYGVVANLGNWTTKALEESYGEPDKAKKAEWRKKYRIGPPEATTPIGPPQDIKVTA